MAVEETQSMKIYMAPLRGLTDHTFRRVYTQHFPGFDLALAPFISSKRDRKFKPKYVKDVLPENNLSLPVVPQILGNSGEDFVSLALYMAQFGHTKINWNLGCPFPMVAGKKRGSGLLPYKSKIQAFLDHVFSGYKGRLSIKMRLGWASKEEGLRLMAILNQYPIDEVILHPRTGEQRYDGNVDLAAFGQFAAVSAHRLVYNGDINSRWDFERLKALFPEIDHWMIGRGCLSDPYLPMTIKSGNCDRTDCRHRIKKFHDDLFAAYGEILSGPTHVLNKMKGFWQYWAIPYAACKKELKSIRKSRTPEQYQQAVNRIFEMEGHWA